MVPDFDPEIVAADASVIEEIEEFLDLDDHDEHDFVVDQPILDKIALARVPQTQHVVPSQIAEVLKAAGRVKETPKTITKEETNVIATGVATKVREHQALMASALDKVNLNLLCFVI
jgi:metal-dependent HD superfamily phosphatase/phosphodiesterase